MLIKLNEISKHVNHELRCNAEMEMTKEDEMSHARAVNCYLCKKEFSKKPGCLKVRDHCHRTSKYRGAACQTCNINYYTNRFLPVLFHNLSGYDSHFIIQEAYKIREKLGERMPVRYPCDDKKRQI